nr:transglycosylase domain-containing protein [uncultured Oscillibacter sp.]
MATENRQPARREPRARKRGGIAGKICFVLMTLVLIGICTAAIIAGIFMKYVETTLAPTLQVNPDDYTMELSSIIYYQDQASGDWVEYQTVHGVKNRIWVDIEDMPDALWQAVVAIEDERFFTHNGVDWKRTIGATANMFIGMKDTFGGSTITQQMLKNMTLDNKPYVNRKVREIFRALEFEKNYTKADILELYLNSIYLGQGCYGVQTAAQFYFGKDVSELDVAECASLIAITNNPSMYGPMYDIKITVEKDDGTTEIKTPRQLNKQRQENILKKMSEVKGPATLAEILNSDPESWDTYITEEEKETYQNEVLQFTDGDTSVEELVEEATGGDTEYNSWFVDQVIRDVVADLVKEQGVTTEQAYNLIYNSGYHIYTTLDPEIQEIAESVYEDRSNLDITSRSGQQLQSGITVLDPYTGDIVAIVGKVGEKEGNLVFSCATTKRQVGSSIKPLTVYAPAVDAGAVTPGTTFDNYPVRLLSGNPWPKNSPNTYTGWTTVQTGVQKSINTIAVQTLETLGVEASYTFATENLGLSLDAADIAVSPLGLGGLTYGLSTVEMAAAYATFANGGLYNAPRTYVKVTKVDTDGNETVVLENETESHVAMKESTAYLMNKMLKSVVSGGTGTSANFGGMTIAGKTGTTSDSKDRYFVGYTPYYVAAVWTGYETPEVISTGTTNPAITMWKKVMQKIHEDLPNKDFEVSASGVENIQVCADSGLKATAACQADVRGSRVISVTVAKGTAPTEECTLHTMVDYCTEGKCLATESCPEGSVKQVGVLDYVRENYGPSIKATDDPYLLINMQKAIGLAPTVAEDGTESYPEVIGCPVHAGLPLEDPEDPLDPALDPNDPNYNPPDPNEEGNGSGGEPGETPTTPEEPDEPAPTDPSGGVGDAGGDWWSGFWGNQQ